MLRAIGCSHVIIGHSERRQYFGETLIVAYEPVWAIGTGKTATPQMAVEAHEPIREQAAKAFGDEAAATMRILYGGSVKPENAKALMAESEIDGALVGWRQLGSKVVCRDCFRSGLGRV